MLKLLGNDRGTSLIEQIFTVIVLSLGLLGGLLIIQNTTVNAVGSDLNSVGSLLAREKAEVIIADNAFNGYDTIITSNYPDESFQGSYAGFSRTVSILEVDPTDMATPLADSGVKKIDVTVNWGSSSVTASTLVSDY